MVRPEIKYRATGKALPPRLLRASLPGWGGSPELKKENGSQPQPWHCPLHMEGATHGFELLFQYDTEARIVNEGGDVRIIWDYASEAGATPDFTLGAPPPIQNYLFGTSLDIQAPPGYVLRTTPHPRFFRDSTGTVPAAFYGHVHSEWWPKKLFVVFKAPEPGQVHVFRKGEPYVQILFVPDQEYQLVKMDAEEESRRTRLENDIRRCKSLIARHVWHSAGGFEFNDHYKVLERAFDRGGLAAVEALVREGVQRYDEVVPRGKSVLEYFDIARRFRAEGKLTESKEVLHHVMAIDPRNPEVHNRIAQLEWDSGVREDAIRTMSRAARMRPAPPYLGNLGQMLTEVGRHSEAEAAFRASLAMAPNDANVLSCLGLQMAQTGRLSEGSDMCSRAAAMSPPSAPARHRLGLIHLLHQRFDAARRAFESALAADPSYAAARASLEELHAKLLSPPDA